jgi:hypothetical protein
MLRQVHTITNELQMVEVDKGTVPVISIRVLRHSADYDDGIQDSWFLETTCRLRGFNGGTCRVTFTPKRTAEHGDPKSFVCAFASTVLMAHEIDLKHWDYDPINK